MNFVKAASFLYFLYVKKETKRCLFFHVADTIVTLRITPFLIVIYAVYMLAQRCIRVGIAFTFAR